MVDLGPWWGATNAICHSLNVDRLVVLLGGDTSQHYMHDAAIKLI